MSVELNNNTTLSNTRGVTSNVNNFQSTRDHHVMLQRHSQEVKPSRLSIASATH